MDDGREPWGTGSRKIWKVATGRESCIEPPLQTVGVIAARQTHSEVEVLIHADLRHSVEMRMLVFPAAEKLDHKNEEFLFCIEIIHLF